MLNWKIVAFFGGFALVLSFFVGVIGGVSMGTILLRALLWGVIFALIGGGIQILAQNMLPGLLDDSPPPEDPLAAAMQAHEGGSEIDMELPEENPHEKKGDDFDELSSSEEENPAPLAGVDGPSESPANKGEEDLEEIGDNPFKETEDVDTLPDIEAFTGSFSGFDSSAAGTADATFFSAAKDSVEINGEAQDPAQAARAIHTWLERDKEG